MERVEYFPRKSHILRCLLDSVPTQCELKYISRMTIERPSDDIREKVKVDQMRINKLRVECVDCVDYQHVLMFHNRA